MTSKTSSALPTAEEMPKITEFRKRIGNIYPECDQLLLVWLRARDLNVDKAEYMLRRHLIWRKNNEIRKLKDWESPKSFLPYIHCGFDYEKYPIFILPIGRWDLRGLIESGDMLPTLKFIYQCLENIFTTAIEQNTFQGVVICDFDGFGYRQIAHRTVIQGMIEVLRVFEANYPESLKALYVINAPKIFPILFAILKPFLHSRTLSKIQIYGPDRDKWQSTLFKVISSDQIPHYWGGNRPGNDAFCSNDWFREPLPTCFLRKSSVTMDDFGEEWYSVKVAAKEQLKMEYIKGQDEDGMEMEYILKWSFTTDDYDIGFSIYHEEENEFIVPYKRVESHLKKVEGNLKLKQKGKYVINFDNSYSRSRAKTLHYSVSFIAADEITSTPGMQRKVLFAEEKIDPVDKKNMELELECQIQSNHFD